MFRQRLTSASAEVRLRTATAGSPVVMEREVAGLTNMVAEALVQTIYKDVIRDRAEFRLWGEVMEPVRASTPGILRKSNAGLSWFQVQEGARSGFAIKSRNAEM